MSDPTDGQIKEGLAEILTKSSQLMARGGFAGTSMRDLAQATGRSLSGLYHYFQSKEDLLYLINHEGFSTVIGDFEDTYAKIRLPEARLYAFIYNHVMFFLEHRDEMRVLLWGTHTLSPERRQTIRKLKDHYLSLGECVVQEVLYEKTGVNLSKRELSRKTLLLFGMLNWIYGWYSPEKYGSPEKLCGDIYSIFLQGIVGRADWESVAVSVKDAYAQSRVARRPGTKTA